MRLLNTRTLQLEEFPNERGLKYAILSHRWEADEVLFDDVKSGSARKKAGYAKINGCCRMAEREGFEYVWIDTCCINKVSSAELSEAINSMYR